MFFGREPENFHSGARDFDSLLIICRELLWHSWHHGRSRLPALLFSDLQSCFNTLPRASRKTRSTPDASRITCEPAGRN